MANWAWASWLCMQSGQYTLHSMVHVYMYTACTQSCAARAQLSKLAICKQEVGVPVQLTQTLMVT